MNLMSRLATLVKGEPETIYRFESACGRYCYVGRTKNLPGRIRSHGSKASDSAIARHCRECPVCRHARNKGQWNELFTKIGRATGDQNTRELETKKINSAFEQYLLNPGEPFPLNEKVEDGNPALLRVAKYIRKERGSREEQAKLEKRLRVLQARMENAEKSRDRALARLGRELRRQGKAWGRPALKSGRQIENLTDAKDHLGRIIEAGIRSLSDSGPSP